MVDLNKQKSLFFMELFLYLIFLDLDKIDVYRDKSFAGLVGQGRSAVKQALERLKNTQGNVEAACITILNLSRR